MTEAPKHVRANPKLSTWMRVDADGTIHVQVGKVELGQGILTALTQIAADELDADTARVLVHGATTAGGPDEGPTAGSMSVADSGEAVRAACAHTRSLFVAAAARRFGVDPADVDVRAGTFGPRGRDGSAGYGDLAADVDLDVDIDATVLTKKPDESAVTGSSLARVDLPGKVRGRARFIQDIVRPGQLWGQVVRPPSPAASLMAASPRSVEAMRGVVAVVCDGSFLGVVADDEHRADLAAEALRATTTWQEHESLPDEDDLTTYLRDGPVTTFDADVCDGSDDVPPTTRQLASTYTRPFLAHASMSPSCGMAQWSDAGTDVHVWSHSQNVFGLRRAIAAALGLDAAAVSVEHAEGAGAYGHNGADDAAFDAVLLARAVPGRPVHVRWRRPDELSWAPFGSPMTVDVRVGLSTEGRLVCWEADVWSQGHTSRPGFAGSAGLLAYAHLAAGSPLPDPIDPPAERGAGSTRNAVPGYTVPVRRIRGHRRREVALRTSSLRTLGAFGNVFAIESMMDEAAECAGADPLDFRLVHLDDDRGRAVLQAVADHVGWADRPRGGDVGLGIGYARYKARGAYCAVIAEVEAVTDVRVRRLTLAVDVGRVVNPDGVRNQIEGGAVQSTSWTLKERVRFDRTRITSTDWETYPILRFSETPEVEVLLLDRPELPSVGSGEASQGPTAGAIANAVAAAIGVRVRDLPITADRIVEAIRT
ncbi:MAG: molybdopterin cofactor-binding domain-containing protein [Actinomycetes bacterium]